MMAYPQPHETILVDRSDLGVITISGESRLDLLNRMSTQQLATLPLGHGAATILTSDIGRIIDRLLIYALEDALLVLTGEGNGENIIRYLLRFVFFNDDFHMVDVGTETAVFGLYGPQAVDALTAAGVSVADLDRHHWQPATIAGHAVSVHQTDPIYGDGYFIVGPANADVGVALSNPLVAAGARLIDAATFDALRIAAGHPRFGHELTLDYIPLEAGLWDDVSFNKGCYIGQEIIARMESRGRLAKQLVRLRSDQPPAVGETLYVAGKKAGTTTSVATIPSGAVSLAYIKTALLADDLVLETEAGATLLVEK